MATRSVSFAILSIVVALLAPGGTARAAESYDNCRGFISSLPATIATQGVWCLKQDLATAIASGEALTIDASNVTLDCNGYKIGGLGAGLGTETVGIHIPERLNVTVRNCSVRGFFRGLLAQDGAGHVVEDNRFDGNTAHAIDVFSPGSVVRRNLVVDTGASTVDPAKAIAISVWGGTDVIDNTVSGIYAPTSTYDVIAISADQNDGGAISGNRIRGLFSNPLGAAIGIYVTTGGVVIDGNRVVGNGVDTTYGVMCFNAKSSSVGNVVIGASDPVTSCHSTGDVINPN